MQGADSKKKAKGYSPMDKIMFMCAAGCLMRFVWVFTIFNGRRKEDLLLGVTGDTILVKVSGIRRMGRRTMFIILPHPNPFFAPLSANL